MVLGKEGSLLCIWTRLHTISYYTMPFQTWKYGMMMMIIIITILKRVPPSLPLNPRREHACKTKRLSHETRDSHSLSLHISCLVLSCVTTRTLQGDSSPDQIGADRIPWFAIRSSIAMHPRVKTRSKD